MQLDVNLANAVNGILIVIVGWFLKDVMTEIKKMRDEVNRNKTKIDVIENDYLNKHDNLVDKIESLNDNMKDLNSTIRHLATTITTSR